MLSARLSPEEGALVLAALEAGRAKEIPDGAAAAGVAAETPPAVARNAEALVGAAQLALSAVEHDDRGDARCQVVLHADAAVLAGDEPDGRCYLENGPSVPPETGRRLSCDAEVIAVIAERQQDSPLDVGRKTRRVSPALRRALRVRDGGCRFPGCSNRRFVDAHHIVHWLQGGETKLLNLILLCRRHHRLVHEEGYRIAAPGDGEFTFTRPNGQVVAEAPPLEPVTGPDIEERNERARLTIDPGTCRSLGEGESFDLGMTIDAVLYPELRRRGRTWGVAARAQTPPAASWSYQTLHERLLELIPEFAPLFDEHLEDFEEVLLVTLFDSFTSFVLDARETADTSLVNRCLEFLAAAVGSGDEEIQQLIANSFLEAVGPWDPEMGEFVATWPDALRLEVNRQVREVLVEAV